MKVLTLRLELSMSNLKLGGINQIEVFKITLKFGEKPLLCGISTQRWTAKGYNRGLSSDISLNKVRWSLSCAWVNKDKF